MEKKKPQDTESRHADKYIVRFPAGMRDRIAEAAKAHNRSMNAEIVARLSGSFEGMGQEAARRIAELEAQVLDSELEIISLNGHLNEVATVLQGFHADVIMGVQTKPEELEAIEEQAIAALEIARGAAGDLELLLQKRYAARKKIDLLVTRRMQHASLRSKLKELEEEADQQRAARKRGAPKKKP